MDLDLKDMVVVVICVVGGILVILGLASSAGTHWGTVAGNLTVVSVLIVVFIIVVSMLVNIMR